MRKALLFFGILLSHCVALHAQNAPVAVNDTLLVSKNSNSILSVTANDTDTSSGGLTVTISIHPPNGGASVINQNQVNYAPKPFYYGPDSFTYIVCNKYQLCDSAVVYIKVTGSNVPPVAVDDHLTLQDTVTNSFLPVDTNDYDPEEGPFYIASAINLNAESELGTISLDQFSGNILFTRKPLACGSDSFAYVLCDTFAMCDTGMIYLTITCPDAISQPQGFSPNGDGKNDKLVFTGLEYFSPANLKVFNRYGNPVFESDDYQNNWEGTNRDNGKPLPDGTYFYTLELPNKQRYTNYLILSR